MSWGMILLFLPVLLVLAGIAVRQGFQLIKLRKRLGEVVSSRAEISGFLSRFASGIREEEGIDGAMHSAARYVCEQSEAEAVAIFGVEGSELYPLGVCGSFPLFRKSGQLLLARNHDLLEAMRQEAITSGDGFLGEMLVTRRAELVPFAATDPRFDIYPEKSRLGSVMAVPMLREGMLSGVICAVNNRILRGHSFSSGQFERLQMLAAQVLMVQQLVQVYSEISRRARLDQELGFMRQLQNELLPRAFEPWGGFTVHACSRSAKEVNGDFYDFIRIDDNRYLVLIGDACGKGMPACLMAAVTRSFARSLAPRFTTLPQFLRDLNNNLNRDIDADRFITLGCCLLDKRGGILEFGRAGHTDLTAFVHRHLRVFSPDGTALGMLPDEFAEFETICIALESGSRLMLFSDGLSEALDHNGQEFGFARLSESFRAACEADSDPEHIIDHVMKTVSGYEAEQGDDQTMIVICRQ